MISLSGLLEDIDVNFAPKLIYNQKVFLALNPVSKEPVTQSESGGLTAVKSLRFLGLQRPEPEKVSGVLFASLESKAMDRATYP